MDVLDARRPVPLEQDPCHERAGDDVEVVPEPASTPDGTGSAADELRRRAAARVSPRLDLRGERVESALEQLDAYVDAALLAGLQVPLADVAGGADGVELLAVLCEHHLVDSAAVAADLPALALVAAAASLVAGLFALLSGRRSRAQQATTARLHTDITELEGALAAQVQARISAEEAVRSLGEQLASAQRESTATKASPLAVPLAERTSDALTDAATGLFSEEYFLVAVDARIAAARRHLRPVGVVMLEVVEGLRTEQPQPADPAMVAETIVRLYL